MYLASEFKWQIDELIDWYKSEEDMKDIARLDMSQVKEVVRFYIDNYELCRSINGEEDSDE